MATASAHGTTASIVGAGSETGLLARGIRSGLIASVAMAMVMMVLGLFDRGFFAAPSSIWAFWAGPSAYAPTTFSIGFVLGAMGHMMNSAILGIVFALIASKVLHVRGAGSSVAAGMIFGVVVMALMWIIVLPLGANASIVKESAATWIWVAGHAAYGMVAGALFALWR